MAEASCDFAPAHGGDPVFANGKQIGSVTSSGYGARTDKHLFYAFVKADAALSDIEVGILGKSYKATYLDAAVFDPENQRVRQG